MFERNAIEADEILSVTDAHSSFCKHGSLASAFKYGSVDETNSYRPFIILFEISSVNSNKPIRDISNSQLPNFYNAAWISKVFHVSFKNQKRNICKCNNQTILQKLGVSTDSDSHGISINR